MCHRARAPLLHRALPTVDQAGRVWWWVWECGRCGRSGRLFHVEHLLEHLTHALTVVDLRQGVLAQTMSKGAGRESRQEVISNNVRSAPRFRAVFRLDTQCQDRLNL